MKIVFKVLSIISVLMTLVSLMIFFIFIDRLSGNNEHLLKFFIFLGISLLLISYQYTFRHEILSENKEKTGKIVAGFCIVLSITMFVLSIFQIVAIL